MAISDPARGLRATVRLRGLFWLYSNRHIAGSLLACVGPALLFGGVIRDGWLWITAGLYAIGALLAPSPRHLERRIADALTLDGMLVRLDALIAEARPILDDPARGHLDGIRASVRDVLPRLMADTDGVLQEASYTVRETVARYLPETLANYAALPPAFRIAHPIREGRTARQLLGEQLALLDARLRETVGLIARDDAQALLSNGQFLRDRFGTADFQVT
ncbi:MAG: hypothetical protein RL456_1302 [Pseudomonadota bacterium]